MISPPHVISSRALLGSGPNCCLAVFFGVTIFHLNQEVAQEKASRKHARKAESLSGVSKKSAEEWNTWHGTAEGERGGRPDPIVICLHDLSISLEDPAGINHKEEKAERNALAPFMEAAGWAGTTVQGSGEGLPESHTVLDFFLAPSENDSQPHWHCRRRWWCSQEWKIGWWRKGARRQQRQRWWCSQEWELGWRRKRAKRQQCQ